MNYLIPESDTRLFVTHETGYQNLKVYASGQQLVHLTDPEILRNGHTVQHQELGEIDLRFVHGKKLLEIRVNELLCVPEKSAEESVDNLKGLSRIFWALTILSVIGLIFQAYTLIQFRLSVVQLFLALFFSFLSSAAYLFAAIFTRKGKAWAYFVGTGVFLFGTVIYAMNVITYDAGMAAMVVLFIRLGILGLLLYFVKSVVRVMNAPKEMANQDILDNF